MTTKVSNKGTKKILFDDFLENKRKNKFFRVCFFGVSCILFAVVRNLLAVVCKLSATDHILFAVANSFGAVR
jgi:hypothetical protein